MDFQLKTEYFLFRKIKLKKTQNKQKTNRTKPTQHNVCYNIQSLWHFKNPTRGILAMHRNVFLSKTLTRFYY